eukprot:456153_1
MLSVAVTLDVMMLISIHAESISHTYERTNDMIYPALEFLINMVTTIMKKVIYSTTKLITSHLNIILRNIILNKEIEIPYGLIVVRCLSLMLKEKYKCNPPIMDKIIIWSRTKLDKDIYNIIKWYY